MTTVKISSKNQVVVPKEARDHLGVGPGDELLVVPKGGRLIVLRRPPDVLEDLAGSAKGIYGGGARYLRKERKSWRKRFPKL
jgi:AbrB family looped-hinge helix DNA binding protein